jgi:hypothetical protein
MLDNQIKTFTDLKSKITDAKAKRAKAESATIAYNFVNRVLRRYSHDQIRAAVQREAMALFASALALAVLASTVFWALVVLAVAQNSPLALDGYGFFRMGSFLEAMVWAWGCMTTAIDLPGALTPTWLKVVHSLVLLSGLFQFTFLIACFSIMTTAEADRTIKDASRLLTDTQAKLAQTRALEMTVIDVVIDSPDAATASSSKAGPD